MFIELPSAEKRYLELEKKYTADPSVQVVQVSVEDIKALKTAFPNYYLDTTAFIEALKQAIN